MFTVGRWRQCQLCLAHARSACTCVCVWMIQQLVQLQSVSAARAHSRLTGENKQTHGAFILVFSAKLTVSQPVQVKTHVGDPVELGEAGQQQRRGRAAAAERRGEQRRVSASRLPVDFIRIYRDFHRPFSDWTSTHPAWHPAALIQPSRLRHFRILTSDASSLRQVSPHAHWHLTHSVDLTHLRSLPRMYEHRWHHVRDPSLILQVCEPQIANRPWTRAEGASVTADLHCAGESVTTSETH